jgi:hypothetical protein
MQLFLGEVDEDLITSNICWMVTFNMEGILVGVKTKPMVLEHLSQMAIPLYENKLIIIGQDIDSQDHWFAAIGDNGNVHILEHLQNLCNSVETMKIPDFIKHMEGIERGSIPDRFYHSKGNHKYIIQVFDRKPLTKQVVLDYIK